MQLFAAIDFETATSERTSACAIGYVIFNKTKIIKKASHLIKPPKPEVHFTDIHGLTSVSYTHLTLPTTLVV